MAFKPLDDAPAGSVSFRPLDDTEATTPTAADYLKGAASGVGGLVSGIGYLAEAAGANQLGGSIRGIGDTTQRYWQDSMTPAGQRAAQSQVFDDDPGSALPKLGDRWGQALAMGAAQSAPSMVAAAIPGGLAAMGLRGAAGIAASRGIGGALAPLAAGTAAPVGGWATNFAGNLAARAPTALGFGAAEGAVAGASNAAQWKSDIEQKPLAELRNMPGFAALEAQIGEQAARQQIAEQGASDILWKTALSTGAIGALTGGGALGSAFQRVTTGAKGGILGAIGRDAAKEAGQEIPQSGGERAIQNIATRDYLDPSQSITQGVLADALSGGAIGGVMGGVTGGGSHLAKGPLQKAVEASSATIPPDAGIAAGIPAGNAGNAGIPFSPQQQNTPAAPGLSPDPVPAAASSLPTNQAEPAGVPLSQQQQGSASSGNQTEVAKPAEQGQQAQPAAPADTAAEWDQFVRTEGADVGTRRLGLIGQQRKDAADFAELARAEAADLGPRRLGIAIAQRKAGIAQDAGIEAATGRVEAARQRQAQAARDEILDSLELTTTGNTVRRFGAALRAAGITDNRVSPAERERIARRVAARDTLIALEQPPQNELTLPERAKPRAAQPTMPRMDALRAKASQPGVRLVGDKLIDRHGRRLATLTPEEAKVLSRSGARQDAEWQKLVQDESRDAGIRRVGTAIEQQRAKRAASAEVAPQPAPAARKGIAAGLFQTPPQPTTGGGPLPQSATDMPIGKYGIAAAVAQPKAKAATPFVAPPLTTREQPKTTSVLPQKAADMPVGKYGAATRRAEKPADAQKQQKPFVAPRFTAKDQPTTTSVLSQQATEMPVGRFGVAAQKPKEPSGRLYKGIPVDKPAGELTDDELHTISEPDSRLMRDRNAQLARHQGDPRFLVRIPGNLGAWETDFFAVRNFLKDGSLTDRGRMVTAIMESLRSRDARFDDISQVHLAKTAGSVLTAIETGRYNSILHPDNKNSRAVFEQITGIKLPSGVKATQNIFSGNPFEIAWSSEDAKQPHYDTIQSPNGQPFKSQLAARRAASQRGVKDTHDVVPASEVSPGATGFVLRKKLAGQEQVQQMRYAGMTAEEAAKLASKHGHDYDDALRKIVARPSAWVQQLNNWLDADKAGDAASKQAARLGKWQPNELQRRVLNVVQESGGRFQKTDVADRDIPMFAKYRRSTLALIANGKLTRVDLGDYVQYSIPDEGKKPATGTPNVSADISPDTAASQQPKAPVVPASDAPPVEPTESDRRLAETRQRVSEFWLNTARPALDEYFAAFGAMGSDRLERNMVKPEGLSATDWLLRIMDQRSTWDRGRRTGKTGIQMLSQKDFWPGPEGQRLRKAMLAAIKALRVHGYVYDWIKSAEIGSGDVFAEGPDFAKANTQQPSAAQVQPDIGPDIAAAQQPQDQHIEGKSAEPASDAKISYDEASPTRKDGNDPANERIEATVDQPLAEGESRGLRFAPARGARSDRYRPGRADDRGVRGAGRRADGSTDESKPLGDGGRSEAVSDGTNGVVAGGVRRVSADFRPGIGALTREGSWFDAAKRNIDLIELAIQIDNEKRNATPDEQELLAKYVGFGAGAIRNELFPVPSAWAKSQEPNRLIWPSLVRDARWKPLAERIEALPREWQQSILQSTQYAHYTSEGIIRSIWSAIQRLGFTGGNIFEPGTGIGSFSMLMPDGIHETSRFTGVEFDAPTALIARLLSPDQQIQHDDFIKRKFPKNYFDVNVGNPPFSQTKILGDAEYAKHGFMLHDFFFAKGIDLVRPGGLQVFVTSKGTMDKKNDRARKFLSDRADLIGAIRLPSTAFEGNAGTSVVTDVIFLKKRAPGEAPGGMAWGAIKTVDTKDGPVEVNEYFADHPEMILGQQRISGNIDDLGRRVNSNGYGGEKYTVVSYDSSPAELDAKFAEAVERLPQNVYSPLRQSDEAVKKETRKVDFDPSVTREGVIYLDKDGAILRVASGVGVPLDESVKLSDKDRAWLKGYVGIRDLVQAARLAQVTDGDWKSALRALNKAYDAFRAERGPILDFRTQIRKSTDEDGNIVETESRIFKNKRLYREDYDSALLTSLESISESGEIVKAPFLLGRTIGKPVVVEVKGIGDALAVSLDSIGSLDLADIGRRMGLSREDTIEALGNQIYKTPSGQWQLADEYLSGDVVTKLEEAEHLARTNPEYRRNVEALKEVQPEKLGPSQISAKLGASWVPVEHVNEFAKEIGAGYVTFDIKTETWQVEGGNKRTERKAGAEYGTAARSPSEILEAVLNSRSIKVVKTEDKKTVTDIEATTAANEMAKKIKDKFKGWVWTDTDRAAELVEAYNKRFNNIAPRKFDGSHLTLPGVSLRFKLHPHQLRSIWRQIQTGNTYLAHAVGAGKTIEMIAGAMEQKRLGLIKKPMFVVPNHMLEQFSNEFMELYPLANIMVADDENFSAERRRAFIASATLNSPDAIIITHSAFKRIGVTEASVAPIRDEILSDLEMELSDLAQDQGSRVRRSQLQQQIEAVSQRFDAIINASGKDSTVKFEDIGADFIYADEAHAFRKLDFHTAQSIKGIDPNGSQAAMDMCVKTRVLEKARPGRSFVFASGTPVTNTMGELFTIMRFFNPREMDKDGISTFDSWARQFGEVAPALEPNAAGKYELIERFAKFDNVPELMSRIRQFMDVLTSESLGALVKRPDLIGGKPHLNIVEPTDALNAYMKNVLAQRIEASRAWKPSPQEKSNPDPIVSIITDGRFAAIDPRFFGSALNGESIITTMAGKVAEKYHATKNNVYYNKDGKPEPIKGSTQIVFYNLGFGAQSQINRGFNARAAFTKLLTEKGIPRSEIAWFDDANTDAKKEAIFKDMRSGKLKVLIGSAKKMGTGVNVQNRLIALHYQDPPWFPADVEQPHGRIIRQGNMNPEVSIDWYTTKGTYQSTMWQMVGRKQRFIDQAFTGDKSLRSMDDLGEASLFEQAAAVASGDPRALQLAGLRQDVERFERLQAAHANEQINVRSALRNAEWSAGHHAKNIDLYAKAFKAIGERYFQFEKGDVNGRTYVKAGEFGQALKDEFNRAANDRLMDMVGGEAIQIASLGKSIQLSMEAEIDKNKPTGNFVLSVDVGGARRPVLTASALGSDTDATGLARKVFNQVNDIEGRLRYHRQQLAKEEADIIRLRKKRGAPFEYQQEMAEKYGDLKRLEAELQSEGAAPTAAPDTAVGPQSFAPRIPYGQPAGRMSPVDSILFNRDDQSNISPSDRAIYEMANEGKSTDEILSFLSKASRRPFNRLLATALQKAGLQTTVTTDSQGGWQVGNRSYAQKYAAAYSPKADKVALFTPRDAERHVLHELVHAATLRAIESGGVSAMRMRALFKHVQQSGKLDGQYGMSSLDEFVAEVFSNPKFRDALQGVPAPASSALKSVWQWFVRIVARIVGIKTQAAETALDRALRDGLALMEENAAIRAADEAVRFSVEGSEASKPLKLRSDIPNDYWLQGKVNYAKSRGKDGFGVPYMGVVTGTFNRNVMVPVAALTKIKGMRGEQSNVRGHDLKSLIEVMQETGKLPLGSDGKEYAPFITVAYDGSAWVNEGNHRIMAAAKLGWKELPVEIRYFDGGELADGPMSPSRFADQTDDDVRFNVANNLPPTITINGVERPTTNSNGKPIHPTVEGVRNFYAWFKNSAVVDEQNRPLVVYHGTDVDFSAFDKDKIKSRFPLSIGYHFTTRPSEASMYAANNLGSQVLDGGNVIPAYAMLLNPLIVDTTHPAASMEADLNSGPMFDKIRAARLSGNPHDGIIIRRDRGDEWDGWNVIAFKPEQIKSATGNRGTFDGTDPDIRYNIAADWQTAPTRAATTIRQYVADSMRSDSNTSWLTPFNTQYHKAEKWAAEGKVRFKHVFNIVQQFIADTSRFAVMSQNAAPALLHEIKSLRDVKALLTSKDVLGKQHRADIEAIASPLYDGTLYGGGNPLAGLKWSDSLLRTKYNLTDRQIKLYHEALAAVKVSMDEMAKSLVARHAKRVGVDFDNGMALDDMVADVAEKMKELQDDVHFEFLSDEAKEAHEADILNLMDMDKTDEARKAKSEFVRKQKDAKEKIAEIEKTIADIKAIESKAVALQEHGYFPLMRFGRHTVTAKDAEGKTLFFGMYDGIPLVPRSGQAEANRVKREVQAMFPDATVETGIINDEKYKLYQGLNLDAMQIFAEHMDKDDLAPVQEFIRLATNSRSAMKRLMHREGTPGFDRDVRRTLAQFIVSNARSAASNYHNADMLRAAEEANKDGGDIGREAVRLVKYIQNPEEEAQVLRGFLFFQFLGGSIASAVVNLTQTPAMTLPFLSKFEPAGRLSRRLLSAAKMAVGDPKDIADVALRDALMTAEMDGVTAPQEIHQLVATAANNLFAGSRTATVFLRGWGAPFAMAESVNRRIAFISAFKIAQGMGKDLKAKTGFATPFEFAEDAVNQTQGLYNKGNRMNVGRGAFGATVMTFKQFSIMYLELLKRLPPKQRAIMLGVLLISAGGGGLPGVEDAEDIWDTIGQWLGFASNSKRTIRNTLTDLTNPEIADLAINGLLSKMGIDLHSRLGMQNLLPGTAMLKQSSTDKGREITEVFGPAASVIKSVGDALEKLATGQPAGAAKALVPGAIRNAWQGVEMAATGRAEDARGRATVPVNEAESIAKVIGFNPKSVAQRGEVNRGLWQDQRLIEVKREGFTADIVSAILAGDDEAKTEAYDAMRAWNEDNPQHRVTINPATIGKRVREARSEGTARMVRALPKAMRQQAAEEFAR